MLLKTQAFYIKCGIFTLAVYMHTYIELEKPLASILFSTSMGINPWEAQCKLGCWLWITNSFIYGTMQRKVLPEEVKIFYFPEKTKWLLWDRKWSNDGFHRDMQLDRIRIFKSQWAKMLVFPGCICGRFFLM